MMLSSRITSSKEKLFQQKFVPLEIQHDSKLKKLCKKTEIKSPTQLIVVEHIPL